MNITLLIAGLLASFVVVGHFKFGISWYLKPMLASDFDLIPKATMQSVFHYVSVFLVLAAAVLLHEGLGLKLLDDTNALVKFLGLNYLLFTIVQISYAFKNKVERPLISVFQWTLFLPIGILCLIGA